MFRNFSADTADEVWQRITASFRQGECSAGQESRAGETRELLHAAISIYQPRQRWIVSRQPPLNLAFALAEVVWIITGRNDTAFLNYFNSQLPRFAGTCDTYHGAYGFRLRRHFRIDQLTRAFEILKAKPHSRQVVLQIWDGAIDLPDKEGNESSSDIPCNVISMLKVRGDKLEWTQVLRSNDLFRGLPYNIIQFTTLQEVVAGWLGLEAGTYNHLSDSLHLYESDFQHVRESSRCDADQNTDSLLFPKVNSEAAFSAVASRVEEIIDPTVTAGQLRDCALSADLPTPFKNILLVLCAEGARRRKSPGLALDLISACTNPIYRQMFSHWLERARIRPPSSVLHQPAGAGGLLTPQAHLRE